MITATLIASILLGQSPPAVDKAELLRLASPGWDRLEKIYSRVHGSYETTSSSIRKGMPEPGRLEDHVFDFSGNNARITYIDKRRKRPIQRWNCFNMDYGFVVVSDPETTKYALRQLIWGPPDPEDLSIRSARLPLTFPYAMNSRMAWKAFISRPNFKLGSFKREVTNGVSTAVITFDNQPDPKDWPLILNGRCVFDTANSWQVLESSCVCASRDFKNTITLNHTIQYQSEIDPKAKIRWIKRVDSATDSPGFQVTGVITYQFKSLEVCDHDASHFRLPAFGLPEPPAESKPKSRILP